MKHTYSTNPKLCAISELINYGGHVIVISAGIQGEINAETILNAALAGHGLALSDNPVVIWSTPAEMSNTGKPLLRRLFVDGVTFEWGPDVVFTDAPEIHQAAERCNVELLADETE